MLLTPRIKFIILQSAHNGIEDVHALINNVKESSVFVSFAGYCFTEKHVLEIETEKCWVSSAPTMDHNLFTFATCCDPEHRLINCSFSYNNNLTITVYLLNVIMLIEKT